MARKRKSTRRKPARSNRGVTKLRKINAEAKRIRKANPRKKWQTCIKEAARKVA